MDQQKPHPPPPTSTEDGQSSAIQEFVEILEEHRKNCEQQGKYVEAEIAKNRLIELRAHEDSRQREFMKARHISEKLGVEEAHMLEFRQFNAQWDKKLQEYDDNAQGLLDATSCLFVVLNCASVRVISYWCLASHFCSSTFSMVSAFILTLCASL